MEALPNSTHLATHLSSELLPRTHSNGPRFPPSRTIVSTTRAVKPWSGMVAVRAGATLQQGGGVTEEKKKSGLLRPSPAEGARTVTESCSEGTLSTVSEEGWPLGTEVRFAADMQGNPVLRLMPGATHWNIMPTNKICSPHDFYLYRQEKICIALDCSKS